MPFPVTRLRRLRRTPELRSLARETRLTPTSFIYPLFVCPGEGVRKEIRSMPGVFNISVDEAVKEAHEAKELGVGGIILFGLPEKKDEVATGAWADDGIVQRATRAIKREVPGLLLMGDVCLCEYMSHGHCGLVDTSDPSAKARREALEFVDELKSKGKLVITTHPAGAATAVAAAGMMTASAEEYEILNDPTLE